MFVVISTSAEPVGLRGELTRWILEVAPGTFVGNLSARVKDAVWDLCVEGAGNGSVLLVHAARNEQHLAFRTHGTNWTPVDQDGLTLILRPEKPVSASQTSHSSSSPSRRNSEQQEKSDPSSWSVAARRKRFRKTIERRDAVAKDRESSRMGAPTQEQDPPF